MVRPMTKRTPPDFIYQLQALAQMKERTIHHASTHCSAECNPIRPFLGDFSGMVRPLLVAAGNWQQYDDFVEDQCLLNPEVLRLIGSQAKFERMPNDKILILLPGWEDSPRTKDLVVWWMHHLDRHTIELSWPKSSKAKIERRADLIFLATCFLIIAAIFLALTY